MMHTVLSENHINDAYCTENHINSMVAIYNVMANKFLCYSLFRVGI
jgi:hypothetical protein